MATVCSPDVRLSGEYWRFWSASALSNLGDGVRIAALPLLATRLTDSPVAISAVGALLGLPWVIVGPLGGVIVDRVDRRRLMIVGQLARGAAIAVLALWIWISEPPLLVLYLVTFAVGVGEVFVDTASQAAVPMLAPSDPDGLERANGRLIAAQTVLDGVVGAPVGAALFALGVALPFALDAGSFVVSAALLASVGTPLQPEQRRVRSTIRADLREGIVALWSSRLLRGLAVGVGLVNATLAASFSVLVIFVIDELGASETGYGVLLGVGAVGGFIGALLAGAIVRRVGRRATIIANAVTVAAVSASMGFVGSVVTLTALFAVLSFAVVVFNVTGQSIRQAAAPPEVLGRVVASFRLIGLTGVPIGALAGGAITSVAGVRATYIVAGLFAVVPMVVMINATRHLATIDADVDGDRDVVLPN